MLNIMKIRVFTYVHDSRPHSAPFCNFKPAKEHIDVLCLVLIASLAAFLTEVLEYDTPLCSHGSYPRIQEFRKI